MKLPEFQRWVWVDPTSRSCELELSGDSMTPGKKKEQTKVKHDTELPGKRKL